MVVAGQPARRDQHDQEKRGRGEADAIAQLVPEGKTYAYRYEGERFDCGSKEGFLKATMHYARKAGYDV